VEAGNGLPSGSIRYVHHLGKASISVTNPVPYHDDEYLLRIAGTCWISSSSTHRRKVVRVNDITMEFCPMAPGYAFPAGSDIVCAASSGGCSKAPAAALDPAAQDPIPPIHSLGVCQCVEPDRCAVSASIFLHET